MGTKDNPGEFDAYAKAEPDEPIFVLLARDLEAPLVIHIWVHLWMREIQMGLRPESDRPQIEAAMRTATEMQQWGEEWRARKAKEGMEFDDRGIPLTGPHARKEKSTTSGANDG